MRPSALLGNGLDGMRSRPPYFVAGFLQLTPFHLIIHQFQEMPTPLCVVFNVCSQSVASYNDSD